MAHHSSSGHGTHDGSIHDGPPDALQIDIWVDEILETGGISLPDGAEEELQQAVDDLEETVDADGTVLPEMWSRHIEAIVTDLEKIADNGVTSDPAGEGTFAADDMSLVIHKIDEFLEYEGDNLSDSVAASLLDAQTTLESLYDDGVLSEAEQTEVQSVADDVESILTGDGLKLSDAGLAELAELAADTQTLIDTGFLALDDAQMAIVEGADEILSTLSRGDFGIHEVVDDLRFDLGEHLLALADYVEVTGVAGGGGHGLIA